MITHQGSRCPKDERTIEMNKNTGGRMICRRCFGDPNYLKHRICLAPGLEHLDGGLLAPSESAQ